MRYEIPYIATTIVSPLMKKELHMWRPLEDDVEITLGHKSQLADWQEILDLERAGSGGFGGMDQARSVEFEFGSHFSIWGLAFLGNIG